MERDLRSFIKYSWWIFGLILMNLADLFIMATTYTKITFGLNYFLYFSPGITMLGTFSNAFIFGREINEEKRYGRDQYLLSLPVDRRIFIFGRTLAGALRGIIYSVSLLIIAIIYTSNTTMISNFFSIGFILIPYRSIFEIAILFFFSLAIIFLTSIGMSAFSIAIGTSIKNFENYALSRSFASLWLMFGSTVFYPREKMPEIMAIFSDFNPLSYGVNILRGILFNLPIRAIDIIGLSIFSISMWFLAYFLYEKSIQN